MTLRVHKHIKEILVKDKEGNFRIVSGSLEIIGDESVFSFEGYSFSLSFEDIESYYFLNWWEEF